MSGDASSETGAAAPVPTVEPRAQRRTDIFASALRQQLDEEGLLAGAVGAIPEIVAVGWVAIMLVTESNPVLGAEWRAPGTDASDLAAPTADGTFNALIDAVLERDEVAVLEDVAISPVLDPPDRQAFSALGLRAFVCAPVRSATGRLGVLVFADTGARQWSGREVRVAELAGRELGTALERVRLFAAQGEFVAQLHELDRQQSEFLSIVSHEIRTPLTSIAGYLEMLEDGEGGPLSAAQRTMLDVVGRNVRRLQTLIDDLITLSRIESGVARLERGPVALAAVVDGVAAALGPSAADKSITLVAHCQSELPPVYGDAGQLERGLLNLLSNAVKFTPAGGHVGITASTGQEGIDIAVTDSGIGIPPEDIPRLFGRFFRAANATASSIPGTGLGLAIAMSVAKAHGGSISVASRLGGGTTFTMHLPVRSSPRRPA